MWFTLVLCWAGINQTKQWHKSGYSFALYGVANCSWRGSVALWPGLLPNPLSDHLHCSSAQPNAVQPSSFSHSSFSCPDIFILLLKLLRAHYLRGRNAGLIVWWLQRLDPFFSLCNQPALASCLMFSSQCQAMRGLSRGPLSMDREPSFHCPKHSEQTINHWHAFQSFRPIVSVSPLHGFQV